MAAGVQTLITSYPHPQTHEVHIHCVALTDLAADNLSPDERLRAGRLLDPLKRNRFIAGRSLLRMILGRYLGMQPQELRFSEGVHGKPRLTGDDLTLHFNLSHSGSIVLLAIAADREVGVDLEYLHSDTPFSDMARLAFSPREQEELFALPEHLQRGAFYRCWTRKEAYLKACGVGFALPSNSFDVSLSPKTTTSLTAPDDGSNWILQEIPVPEGYCATLAVQGSAPIILPID